MKTNELNYTTKSPRFKVAASFGALMLAASSAFAATSIGWNYVGRGPQPLAATSVAGAGIYAQNNWNNHTGSGQDVGTTPLLDLFDSDGNITTTDVTGWTQVGIGNSWDHGNASDPSNPSGPDFNIDLMDDFNTREISVTFDDIQYAFYNVVVYYSNDHPTGGLSTLSAGSQSRNITTSKASSYVTAKGYLEGTDANASIATNYTVFENLSGSSLTVALNNVSGNANNGLSAIQIVEAQIPEPSSSLLLGTSGLLLLLRRKR